MAIGRPGSETSQRADEIAHRVGDVFAEIAPECYWAIVYGRDPEYPDAVAQRGGQDPRIAPTYLQAGVHKLSHRRGGGI